jgi:hypothetical protein
VDATAARFLGIVDLYRLLDLGRISGRALLFRQLYLAVLFTRAFRRLAPQLVWTETRMVAIVGPVFARAWADPPACTVGEPRKTYLGERSFPLIMQNVHRYFLYLALIFIAILSYDVWKAMWFADGFGIGIGTIVLVINVVLLSGYTFGCHSLRHLIGGFLDQLSRSPTCYRAYACVSCFNRRHMVWAWLSLFWVGFSDLYVRLCSLGIWHDLRLV